MLRIWWSYWAEGWDVAVVVHVTFDPIFLWLYPVLSMSKDQQQNIIIYIFWSCCKRKSKILKTKWWIYLRWDGKWKKSLWECYFRIIKKKWFFFTQKKSSYGQFLVIYSTYIQVLSKEILHFLIFKGILQITRPNNASHDDKEYWFRIR